MPTGALGVLRYNGVEFGSFTETKSLSIRPVYDRSGRTVIYKDFDFTFRTVIAGSPTDPMVQIARRALLKPGCEFEFSSRGWGDLSVNVGSTKDVKWGPRPQEISLKYLGGECASELIWRIQCSIADCNQDRAAGVLAILEYVYTLEFNVDSSGYTSRNHSGYAVISQTRRNQNDRTVRDTADRIAENVVPPAIGGFRRTVKNRKISDNRNRIDFTFIDEQMGFNIPPIGIIHASASHSVTSSSTGLAKWVHSFRAEYEVAVGYEIRKTAVQAFAKLYTDRLTQSDDEINRSKSSLDKGSYIPISFGMVEPDIYGKRIAQLNASFSRTSSLESMILHSGLWKPAPDSDWKRWHTSVSDAFGIRGNANLEFDPGEDRIIDICDTAPIINPRQQSADPPPRVRFQPELSSDIRKPPPDKSWMDYISWVEIEDDPGHVVVKKLPDKTFATELSNRGVGPAGGIGFGASAPGPAGNAGGSSGGTQDLGFALNQLPGAFFSLPRESQYEQLQRLLGLINSLIEAPYQPTAQAGSSSTATGKPDPKAPVTLVRRGQPIVYVYMSGRALRAGYPIPRPALTKLNDAEVIPANRSDRGEGFRTAIVANYGVPIYAATWRLRYALPSLPVGGVPTPPNPMFG